MSRAWRSLGSLPSWTTAAASWLAVIGVGLLVATLVLAAIAPRLFGVHFVIVAGGSMEPTIPFGSLAVMRDTDPDEIAIGDVVLYPAPDKPGVAVTHRVVGFDQDRNLITRGDANARDDNWRTEARDVRYTHLIAVPKLGSAVMWLRTSPGYLLLVLIPGLAITIGEVRSILRVMARHRTPASG